MRCIPRLSRARQNRKRRSRVPFFSTVIVFPFRLSFFFLSPVRPPSYRASNYSMLIYASDWSIVSLYPRSAASPSSRARLRSDARFAALILLGWTPSVTRVRILWKEREGARRISLESWNGRVRREIKERMILDRSSASRFCSLYKRSTKFSFSRGNILYDGKYRYNSFFINITWISFGRFDNWALLLKYYNQYPILW